MNSDTQWYLGIRGEKTAFRMPWEKEDKGVSPMALGAGGAALGAGGAVANIQGRAHAIQRGAELEGVRHGVGHYSDSHTGKILRKWDPHNFTQTASRVADARFGGEKAIAKAEKGLGKSVAHGNVVKHLGTAGILGGLGLAGYGAYKALSD